MLCSRTLCPLHPPDAGSARPPGPADWQAVQRLLEPGFGWAGPVEGTVLPQPIGGKRRDLRPGGGAGQVLRAEAACR